MQGRNPLHGGSQAAADGNLEAAAENQLPGVRAVHLPALFNPCDPRRLRRGRVPLVSAGKTRKNWKSTWHGSPPPVFVDCLASIGQAPIPFSGSLPKAVPPSIVKRRS